MSRQLSILKKNYPNCKIAETTLFNIDGEILITKEFLSHYRSISIKQIDEWVKKGLEKSIYSTNSLTLFELKDFEMWYLENINTKYHNKDKQEQSDDDEVVYTAGMKVTLQNAKDIQLAEKALRERELRQQEELKTKKLLGESIDVDKVDEQNEGFVAIMLQTLKEKMVSLPTKIENKTKSEIIVILDIEFEDLISRLKKSLLKAKRDNKKRS